MASILVYLDARDLITVAEKWSDEQRLRLLDVMCAHNIELVFSLHNISECCAPLVYSAGESSVMRTLNRLEGLPHTFVAEATIQELELREAVRAFVERREPHGINPFVKSFAHTIAQFETPAPGSVRRGMADLAFELWQEDRTSFSRHVDHGKKLEQLRKADRIRPDFRRHMENFPETIRRNLPLYNIEAPAAMIIEQFAEWLATTAARYPAGRLGYEVYHQILRNVTDSGDGASDIADLAHIDCIPYVDHITLDARMRGYVSQADRAIGASYADRLIKDVDQILLHFASR